MSADVKYLCPACKRELLSRRHKHCQYCGAEIPDNLLFGKAEIDAQKHQWEQSEAKRKIRQRQQDEEEKRKQQKAANGSEAIWFY
jgi:hypothetical protein